MWCGKDTDLKGRVHGGQRAADAGTVVMPRSPDPVVLVGDLNSQPDDAAGAYGTFTAAGYVDAWVVVHGPAGGFTAGQTELLDNVPSKLDHRIDYVLYQPQDVEAVTAEVIGEELDDRTAGGLWPSDHAGVVATLVIR
jgi:endonuclease/exonuclease/phosphatase family metal-dependent hydrolase